MAEAKKNNNTVIVLIALVIVGVVVIGLAMSASQGNKTAEKQTSVKQETQPQPQKTEAAPQPSAPAYTVAKEYGQANKAIVISPSEATDEKLTLLGKELNKKYGSGVIVRIGVFTDEKYALISTDFNAIDSMSTNDSAAYDQAYVAQYNINKNTDLKEYYLYPTRDQKDINIF